MNHLPLQIRQVDDVVVDHPYRSDARGRQIQERRRTQASGPNDKNA